LEGKIMYKRILIPLDGSELAERALPLGEQIARAHGGELILMRVPLAEKMMTSYPAEYSLLWPEQSLQLSQQMSHDYLNQVLARYEGGGLTARALLVEGDVAGGIVDTAVAEKADLIIMSTHGYSGLTRWMLGSVTERVLREAHCPVLAVRDAEPIEQILITLDGSYLAELALEPAFALAQACNSQVTLLQVTPDKELAQSRQAEGIDQTEAEQAHKELGVGIQRHLDRLVERYAPSGLSVKAVVASGSPAATILDHIEYYHVNVAAMATHGRTGLRRWVYGSVTEKVMRGAQCSMLIVRAHSPE
jgi:nucleotide-binding universal stress UspA family protein